MLLECCVFSEVVVRESKLSYCVSSSVKFSGVCAHNMHSTGKHQTVHNFLVCRGVLKIRENECVSVCISILSDGYCD